MAPGTWEQLNCHGWHTPCSRPCHRTAAPLQAFTTRNMWCWKWKADDNVPRLKLLRHLINPWSKWLCTGNLHFALNRGVGWSQEQCRDGLIHGLSRYEQPHTEAQRGQIIAVTVICVRSKQFRHLFSYWRRPHYATKFNSQYKEFRDF